MTPLQLAQRQDSLTRAVSSQSMYTVSFIHSATQVETISRFFTTKKAAVKWFDWVKDQSYVAVAKLYRGEAGAELVQEVTNGYKPTRIIR